MRCPQCGSDCEAQATFCSRCGTRLYQPKPQDKREYALIRVYPSWWRFISQFVLAAIFFIVAAVLAAKGQPLFAAVSLAVSFVAALAAVFARRATSWSITNERLIEYRGLLFSRRREIELADIRSVEVDRRLIQRIVGIGTIIVASAASADFIIRLEDIYRPDDIAEMLRRARLKRLA
jgi:uncharacterized membrane protein YdbT with pleckstrin-like domain